jgi:hypothetical protein
MIAQKNTYPCSCVGGLEDQYKFRQVDERGFEIVSRATGVRVWESVAPDIDHAMQYAYEDGFLFEECR